MAVKTWITSYKGVMYVLTVILNSPSSILHFYSPPLIFLAINPKKPTIPSAITFQNLSKAARIPVFAKTFPAIRPPIPTAATWSTLGSNSL